MGRYAATCLLTLSALIAGIAAGQGEDRPPADTGNGPRVTLHDDGRARSDDDRPRAGTGKGPRVTLHDGSLTEYAGATFGRNQVLTFRGETTVVQGSSALVLWFYHSRHHPFYPDSPSRVGGVVDWLDLVDDAGDAWFGETVDQVSLSHGNLYGYEFPAFPRRSERLELRVYRLDGFRGTSALTAELEVPNPAPRDYPHWRAEPLPSTKRNGDLTVTLRALTTGLEFGERSRPASIPDIAATVACFRVAPWGWHAAEWEPVSVQYSDATGNQLEQQEGRLIRGAGELGFPSFGQLPSDETAWKVRVEFARVRVAGGEGDHRWFEFMAEPARVQRSPRAER